MLNETYWKELRQGFRQHGLDVFHVVLHANPDTLAHRITADQEDQGARQWRLDHIGDYIAARDWMEAAADLVIESTVLSAQEVADSILQAVQAL